MTCGKTPSQAYLTNSDGNGYRVGNRVDDRIYLVVEEVYQTLDSWTVTGHNHDGIHSLRAIPWWLERGWARSRFALKRLV